MVSATEKGMLVGTFDPASIDEIRQQGDDEEEAIKNGAPLDGHRKKAGKCERTWLVDELRKRITIYENCN